MSVNFYNNNAQPFFDSTKEVDMSHVLSRFIDYLKPGAHILDAGCGSGRDSKYFIDKGFSITAFDASESLAKMAAQYIGQPVNVSTFDEFGSPILFDGIWACASLLHVPSKDMSHTLSKLTRSLKAGGTFYCSFKYGDHDVERDGRYFTNCDEERLNGFIKDTPLQVKELWLSDDARPGRGDEQWINSILEKQANAQ